MVESISRGGSDIIPEGVFAINKPPSLSSAQVIRDLQTYFTKSRLFAPLVQQTYAVKDAEARRTKRRRTNADPKNLLKMGHGGTLDPMATGVLIIGVGAGTKRLSDFLHCKKTYETTVLFGKSSDTYDIMGKIVAEAPYQHITRELVEEKLERFRGKIKQVPPIYSALKINGMKAYEYARSGQELPRELESRDMEVEECELVEFFEGGTHDFRWPANEADEADKEAAKKFLNVLEHAPSPAVLSKQDPDPPESGSAKDTDSQPSAPTSGPLPKIRKTSFNNRLSPTAKAALHTHDVPTLSSDPAPAPAVRIRLTVSSGFYVRSFAHDLGLSLGSMGMMASLVRSRQADFSVSTQDDAAEALTYQELEQGEETWGPRVESMLQEWMAKHPKPVEQHGGRNRWENRRDSRDRRSVDTSGRWERRTAGDGEEENRNPNRGEDEEVERKRRRRRNSSSPE